MENKMSQLVKITFVPDSKSKKKQETLVTTEFLRMQI